MAGIRLQYFSAAKIRFFMFTMHPESKASYMELYEDMLAHEDFWLKDFFCNDDNVEKLSNCVGILGTLATMLRQEGDYAQCEAVLKLDRRVLDRYLEMVKGRMTDRERGADVFEYKYNIILFNMLCKMRRDAEIVPSFRALCVYELRNGVDEENQHALFIASGLPGVKKIRRVGQLTKIKDDIIIKYMTSVNKMEDNPAAIQSVMKHMASKMRGMAM